VENGAKTKTSGATNLRDGVQKNRAPWRTDKKEKPEEGTNWKGSSLPRQEGKPIFLPKKKTQKCLGSALKKGNTGEGWLKKKNKMHEKSKLPDNEPPVFVASFRGVTGDTAVVFHRGGERRRKQGGGKEGKGAGGFRSGTSVDKNGL